MWDPQLEGEAILSEFLAGWQRTGQGRRPDDASTKLSVHYLMMAIGKEKEYDQENKVQKR